MDMSCVSWLLRHQQSIRLKLVINNADIIYDVTADIFVIMFRLFYFYTTIKV
jgi:hypothetical protein